MDTSDSRAATVGSSAAASPVVGRVIGTEPATPLEFWVGVGDGAYLQLDDVVVVDRLLPDGQRLSISGVVSQVRARHEGARMDSDVFLVADGVLPAEVSEAAQVLATRFEPEVFVPPLPGEEVRKAVGAERDAALLFSQMPARLPAGLSRDDEPFYLDLEFVDGSRGAHVNISGVSGVATKTSYATFLLYSLFHSGVLGAEAANTKALIFNVKGEDLLFLDHANIRLGDDQPARYARLGLPAGPFGSVACFAPPVRDDPNASPDVAARQRDVTSFFWTIEQFCRDELLPFLFADSEDDRQQYTMVVHNVTARLRHAEPVGDGAVNVDGQVVRSFDDLVELIEHKVDLDGADQWAGRAIGAGTVNAFLRRLHAARPHLRHLVRGDVPRPERHRVDFDRAQVTVVDLHNLNDRAKRFVVGVVLQRAFERKERSGQARPLQFVVLDELNKYAPREGSGPIKEILLDVAERGRSLGMILIGAQQTASEVERRIVANSAVRVVGRLDAAEAARGEYGFLPPVQRQRATIIKPGTMLVAQPELPVPLVVQFPFPAWATRAAEASLERRGRGGQRVARPGRPRGGACDGGHGGRRRSLRRVPPGVVRYAVAMRVLHTSDWHVGKALRGRSRAAEHEAVLAEIADIARRDAVDLVIVAGDLFDSATPTPEAERIVYRGLLDLAEGGRPVIVIAGNHDSAQRLGAVAPLSEASGIHVASAVHPPDDGGVVEIAARGERAQVALLPFPSQRYVVTADLLLAGDAADAHAAYADRVVRILRALTERFRADTINLVVAHLMVMGGTMGGGERGAHTVFDYWVPATAFPAAAQYVALGHLHRRQQLAGPAPLHYCGSPLQLDFGETANEPVVNLVDVHRACPPMSARWR